MPPLPALPIDQVDQFVDVYLVTASTLQREMHSVQCKGFALIAFVHNLTFSEQLLLYWLIPRNLEQIPNTKAQSRLETSCGTLANKYKICLHVAHLGLHGCLVSSVTCVASRRGKPLANFP